MVNSKPGTLWEQWVSPQGGAQSRDHPAFGGGIAAYLYTLAGISEATDHTRLVISLPKQAAAIGWAKVAVQTSAGTAALQWSMDEELELEVHIPVGFTGTAAIASLPPPNCHPNGGDNAPVLSDVSDDGAGLGEDLLRRDADGNAIDIPLTTGMTRLRFSCMALEQTEPRRNALKTTDEDDGAWVNSTDGIHVHLNFDSEISPAALERDAHKFDFVFGAQRHHLSVYAQAKAETVLTWYLPYSRDPDNNDTWWKHYHPSWLLYECDKTTRAGFGYSNNAEATLDFSNEQVVEWQVSTFVKAAAAQGYDGMAMDNLGFHNAHRACGVWRGGKWVQLFSGELVDEAYESAVVTWTQRFTAAAHRVMTKKRKPMKIVPNFSVGGYEWNGSSTLAVGNATDGVLAEMGFTDNGGGPVQGREFENILMHMVNQQRHGKMYASANQCANVTVACRQWALASYLLGKGGSATIFISGIQDYGKLHLWPEYAAPVGVPLGPAVRTTGGLWYRRSSGGLAAVNPTKEPATVPLAQNYVDLYGAKEKAGSLTLPPMTGRVLLTDSRPSPWPEPPVPEQLHLALGRSAEVLVLQWASRITTDPTAKLCSAASVSFGLRADALHATARAECYPFDMRNASFFAQANHLASLNTSLVGAQPGAMVFYQISHVGAPKSAIHNLTVPRQKEVNVAILGDLGTRTAAGEHVATALPAIHSAVAAGEIDWVYHLGDAAYDFDLALDANLCPAPGGATGRLFMNDIANISSRVPYMFLHGNHDKPYDFAYPTELFRNMPSSENPVTTVAWPARWPPTTGGFHGRSPGWRPLWRSPRRSTSAAAQSFTRSCRSSTPGSRRFWAAWTGRRRLG